MLLREDRESRGSGAATLGGSAVRGRLEAQVQVGPDVRVRLCVPLLLSDRRPRVDLPRHVRQPAELEPPVRVGLRRPDGAVDQVASCGNGGEGNAGVGNRGMGAGVDNAALNRQRSGEMILPKNVDWRSYYQELRKTWQPEATQVQTPAS